MDEIKPGIKTTEFWVTAGTNIALAIVGILALRGLISSDEGELWVQLVSAVLVAVVPMAMAIVATFYNKSRAEVKVSANQK